MICPVRPKKITRHLDSSDGHLLEANFDAPEKEMVFLELKSTDGQNMRRRYKLGLFFSNP